MNPSGQEKIAIEKGACHELSCGILWFSVGHMKDAAQNQGSKVFIYVLKCMLYVVSHAYSKELGLQYAYRVREIDLGRQEDCLFNSISIYRISGR